MHVLDSGVVTYNQCIKIMIFKDAKHLRIILLDSFFLLFYNGFKLSLINNIHCMIRFMSIFFRRCGVLLTLVIFVKYCNLFSDVSLLI